MLNRWIRALIVMAAAAAFGFAAHAQQPQSQARFAFVIGNDGYEGAELPTAANDAALVADMLKSAGFDVTGARNLDQETLRASYREFLEKVAASGSEAVAFVYVSGYGMQTDGENYFIPPGARIARAADLALNGVRLSDISRSLGGLPAQARIMVFDLAYAGPFARDGQAPPPGLAIMDAGPGDLIAFNAAPGSVAPVAQPPYGAFAQALAEMAREPGTPIADVFNRVRVRVAELTKGAQVPWRESRIESPIVLFERGADAPPPAVSQAEIEERRARPIRDVGEAEAYALALDRDTVRGYEEFIAVYPSSPYARNVRSILAARREAVTWRRTVQVNTASAYWSYLDRYPRGPNAPAARARLARMQAALDPPPRYDVVEYDVAPPPAEEVSYFVDDRPRYFDVVEAPIEVVYIAPRPLWWSPPPPPVYVEDSYYFLPIPQPVVAPVWIAPPVYVVRPPQPIVVLPPEPGYAVSPYVAAPVALAAGIAAGSIIYRRDRLARPGAGPSRPFLPPIATPPRGRQQTLPAALQQQNLQNFQQRPRPVVNGVAPARPVVGPGGQPLVRPGQQLPGAQQLPGQPGLRPGQQGFAPGGPGGQGLQRPLTQQEQRQQMQLQRQQQMQQQRELQQQRGQQQRELQQQRQQQTRDQQLQRQQQQRELQQQRQQQMQMQQRDRQQQMQQQRERQLQQQRELQQQRGQQMQQQRDRQQQMQQMQQQRDRQQQMQQQRDRQQQMQQMQQQRDRQQQMQQMQQQRDRQQQMQQMQQQRDRQQQMQQMQQQRDRQQQMQQQMQQQRQQQMQQMQQQRQQQQQQQRQQACGRPGLPPCR